MSHPELFRSDGTLHDLAIERRLAGALSRELCAVFDDHIANHALCKVRFEAARAHHESWVAPPLPSLPKNESMLRFPVPANAAANRPLWPWVVPASGIAAAAAAVGLVVSPGLDRNQLSANLGAIPTGEVDLTLQPDEGIGTLSISRPGHVAVVTVGHQGSLTVLTPEQGTDSVAIDREVVFALHGENTDDPIVAIRCDAPFNVEQLFEGVEAEPVSSLPVAPPGCVFSD
jgi:hypothetical protein